MSRPVLHTVVQGQRLGRRVVLDVFHNGQYHMARVVCDCGREDDVRVQNLVAGRGHQCKRCMPGRPRGPRKGLAMPEPNLNVPVIATPLRHAPEWLGEVVEDRTVNVRRKPKVEHVPRAPREPKPKPKPGRGRPPAPLHDGQRFGRRVVVREVERNARGDRRCVVRCDCSREDVVVVTSLNNPGGQQCRSCGRRAMWAERKASNDYQG